jgi:FkbM family methyltransferase
MKLSVPIEIAGHKLRLDLRWRHERRYAAAHYFGIRFEQADVDRLLFERFVRVGDVLLDAGANIGLCSLEALRAGCASVHAFEPVPALLARLREIEAEDLIVHPQALSDRVGQVEFALSESHNQGSTCKTEVTAMFPEVFGAAPQIVAVPCTTIDASGLPHCHVWKIDVEGAEVDLLRGAAATLARDPPRVIIAEVYPDRLDEFRSLLAPTHPVCRRAFIERRGYGLALTDAAADHDQARWYRTSPMYVFEAAPA